MLRGGSIASLAIRGHRSQLHGCIQQLAGEENSVVKDAVFRISGTSNLVAMTGYFVFRNLEP